MQAAEAMLHQGKPGVTKTKIGERKAMFAGRAGTCVEYIPEAGNSRIDELIRQSDKRDIDCWFDGDVNVQLMGSANLKNDFYDIIQTAEPVTRKN